MQISQWLDRKKIHLYVEPNRKEEVPSSIMHFFGAALALLGTIIMVWFSSARNTPREIWGFVIFGLSMIALYTASATYHILKPSVLKRIFLLFDHSFIYVLIAGTYTPILISIGQPGIKMLIMIWALAALGVWFTISFWGRLKALHVIIYLAMGWFFVFFWKDFRPVVSKELLVWIIAGGVVYSTGVLFYNLRQMKYNHTIWHLFVIGGNLCHYIGLFKTLILS